MKYQMITIQSESCRKYNVIWGEYRRPSLRLGRILQTDGSDYRFSSSARLKSGTFLPHSQYNIQKDHETLQQPATLVYPSLVVGHGDHRQPIEIIVLVLLQRSGFWDTPRVRLIQPSTCNNKQLYGRMKENMDEYGIISVSDAEMNCLVSEHRAYPESNPRNTAEDSIKLVNGDKLIVRSAESDFLGADTWGVEFEVCAARPGIDKDQQVSETCGELCRCHLWEVGSNC